MECIMKKILVVVLLLLLLLPLLAVEAKYRQPAYITNIYFTEKLIQHQVMFSLSRY